MDPLIKSRRAFIELLTNFSRLRFKRRSAGSIGYKQIPDHPRPARLAKPNGSSRSRGAEQFRCASRCLSRISRHWRRFGAAQRSEGYPVDDAPPISAGVRSRRCAHLRLARGSAPRVPACCFSVATSDRPTSFIICSSSAAFIPGVPECCPSRYSASSAASSLFFAWIA